MTVKLLDPHAIQELVLFCKMVKPVLLRTGSVTPRAAMLLFASPQSVAAPIIAKLAALAITRATLEMEENVVSI